LVPHPAAPHPQISIDVGVEQFLLIDSDRIEQQTDLFVELSFRVRGATASISLPPFEGERPQQGEQLWEHTCFEAFCTSVGASEYFEFNVAPSRRWAMYQFDSYRSGMRSIFPFMPRIFSLPVDEGYGLQARLFFPTSGQLKLALSAVIEETDGTKSYWALAHPPGAPDFHHPDCFALTLAAPDAP
jgi:hypothetical protein